MRRRYQSPSIARGEEWAEARKWATLNRMARRGASVPEIIERAEAMRPPATKRSQPRRWRWREE